MGSISDAVTSARFSVDTARFVASVKQLQAASGKEANVILREQAKLLVRDAAKMTPPFGDAPVTESWAAQRKIGQNAVRGDLQRMFVSPNQVEERFSSKDPRFGQRLKKALQSGDIVTANIMLERARMNAEAAIEPTAGLHRSQRDSKGHVRKRPRQFFIGNRAALAEYIANRLRFVGLAKSGWAAAASALGLTLPGWITGLGGSGGIREETGEKASITVWNAVPYIQKTGADLRIMQRAVNNRLRNFPKQVEKTVAALARKANR